MIDGVVLAGYLAVAAARGSGRVFDSRVETLLDRLARRVEQRVGRKAIDEVQAEPADPLRQVRLGREIDAVARADPQLVRELASLQYELDHKVGRQFIDAVHAQAAARKPCQADDGDDDRHHGPRRVPLRLRLLARLRAVSRALRG